MLRMAVITMTTCAYVLGVTHNLLMRRLCKQNGSRGGIARTKNVGCVSMMSGTSVWVVVAGFALAVAVAFAGQSSGCVRRVCWCGATSVDDKRWHAVLSVAMCEKTETICCALLARYCLDENLDVHGSLRGVAR